MEDLERKIVELNERIDTLEKKEQKRKRKENAKVFFSIIKLLIVIGVLVFGYIYVNNKFIKPYKEKMDYIEEKVDKVQSINPFNKGKEM